MCLPEPVREDAVACLKPGGIAAGVQAEHNYARRADEPKQVAFVRFGEAVKRHSAQATTLVGPETNERVSEASDRHRQATTTHGHPRTRPPSRALKSWLPTASRMVGSSGLSIGSMTSLVDTVGLLFASASTADLRSLSRNVRSQPGGLLPLFRTLTESSTWQGDSAKNCGRRDGVEVARVVGGAASPKGGSGIWTSI
jgi:hypothetical protein